MAMQIPKLFYSLASRSSKINKIPDDDVMKYVSSLNEDTTFLPELISIIGVKKFLELVSFLGGQKFCVPTPEQILKDIQAIKRGEENGR